MAGIENLEEFVRSAASVQAVAFAAACTERAAPILFWVVSADGRTSDLETYASALDVLWSPNNLTSEQFIERRERIVLMQELAVGDDVIGARAFAYQGAVALHTALGVPAGLGGTVLHDCSSTLRNFSFRLERRCNTRLLDEEDEIQRQDIADLTAVDGDADAQLMEQRQRAAALGRKWLALAVERFG
ncbi:MULTISPECIES: hypothetical protein [unclassified Streptomyces]|uniref:hypothetical protein n=1 Tax=unclassified Streptomyces TaxID=2593676 RepID=UPI00114D2D61|nr:MULTISPECIES: hypothetical protein [unclassified Streptomyces]MYS21867.1 hypothetical protein [Streptomyces sp. SID4948]